MKLRVLILFAIMILTACGLATFERATPSLLTPTIPLALSATQQPSITPTFLPSLTPTPGVSHLLPILEADCFDDYPAPIELPNGEVKSYQLKPWSVEAAFDLIRTIDQNSPPCNENWTGAMPIYSAQNARRRAAQLAVEEAILRYPDNANRYVLQWRKTVNNALLGNSSSDKWLFVQLLQALHEGRTTPETLGNFVLLYSFEIVQEESVPNLFADGGTGYVYWLSAHAGSDDGLYFALREDQENTYTLYPLLGFWALTGSVGGGFSIADHTQDGIPEIAVHKGFRNGSFCWDELNVYQWNKEQFENLTVQGIESGIDGCETDFGDVDSDGFDTIQMVDSGPGSGYTDVYEWNGRFYEMANRIPFSQANTDWGLDNDINIFILQGKFPEAEKLIEQSIAGIQNIDVSQDRKYNFLDYLRFQSGWVKALQNDIPAAKETLASLADSPTDSRNVIVSRAAQDFLDHYAGEKDLYRACESANRHVFLITGTSICDLPTALLLLSRGWRIDQYNDPLATLESLGVQKVSALPADVDGDGLQDWVFSVRKTWHDSNDLYVLRRSGNDSSLAYLTDTDSLLTPFQASTVHLPGSERPAVFLQSGHAFYILQVIPGKYRLNIYFIQTFHDVQNLQFSKGTSDSFVFMVTYFPDQYTPDWEFYDWNKALQQFDLTNQHHSLAQSQWNGPVVPARQAELRLLVDERPSDAIPLLKQVLAMPQGKVEGECWMPGFCVDRSRLRYLLALSYELTGDEAHALQSYWQLWHDDPGSAYAVLARAKLEPVP